MLCLKRLTADAHRLIKFSAQLLDACPFVMAGRVRCE